MTHGITAIEKTFVFNTAISVPVEAARGSPVSGKIAFDTVVEGVKLESIAVKFEGLEYHVAPPSASVSSVAVAAGEVPPHQKHFLDHFRATGKPPTKTDSLAAAVPHDAHFPHEIKFETAIPVASAVTGFEFTAGRHEYAFDFVIPASVEVTTAKQKSEKDISLIVYRFHAVVKAVNATEHGEAFASIVVM